MLKSTKREQKELNLKRKNNEMLTFCIVHRAVMLYLKHLRFFQPRRSAASMVSQITGVKPALRLLSGLTEESFLMPYAPYNLPVGHNHKKLTDNGYT